MKKEENYRVKPIFGTKGEIRVRVPGSKSITNRALLIAALAEGETKLSGALFSEDTADMIKALKALGISVTENEETKEMTVLGCGGSLPVLEGEVYVGNAGTAARFLTALLAFAGGIYRVDAGAQMRKRPMGDLLSALREIGVTIVCEEEEGHFPFRMDGRKLTRKKLCLETTVSSQFLSGVLMAGTLFKTDMEIEVKGERKRLPYVELTKRVMEDFGFQNLSTVKGGYLLKRGGRYAGREYRIEPDVSAACYFYAAGFLLGRSALVEGVHKDSMQGDLRFLDVLEKMGATLKEEKDGIRLEEGEGRFSGVEVRMTDFSDQTMTLAVLALFAEGKTKITGVGHIRHQESDRLLAIRNEVERIGGKAVTGEGEITIFPLSDKEKGEETEVETYGDHRMAMAFTLAGLRREGINIKDPSCSHKTFREFFNLIDTLTKER